MSRKWIAVSVALAISIDAELGDLVIQPGDFFTTGPHIVCGTPRIALQIERKFHDDN